MKQKTFLTALLLLIFISITSSAFAAEVVIKDSDYYMALFDEIEEESKTIETIEEIVILVDEMNASTELSLLEKSSLETLYIDYMDSIIPDAIDEYDVRLSRTKNLTKTDIERLEDFNPIIDAGNMSQADKTKYKKLVTDTIAEYEEEMFNDIIEEYSYTEPSVALMEALDLLEDEINLSSLSSAKKTTLINEVDDIRDDIMDEVGIFPDMIRPDEFESMLSTYGDHRNFYIVLPKLVDTHIYEFEVYDKDEREVVESGETEEEIKLDKIEKKVTFKLTVDIINKSTDISDKTLIVEVEIVDNQAPTLEWAYVEDGKLHFEYSDNVGFDDNTIIMSDGVGFERKVSYSSRGIDVSIPSQTVIKLVDTFNNTSTFTLNITMDNMVLHGDVPNDIAKDLEDEQEGDIEKFKDNDYIMIAEPNKRIDIWEMFSELAEEKFGKFNSGDIQVSSSDLPVGNDGYVLTNKEGLFKFRITHAFYGQDVLNVYVLVDGNTVKYTNIADLRIKNPYIIYDESVMLSQFLHPELINETYQPNYEYIIARNLDTGDIIGINDRIDLELEKVMNFEIIDMQARKSHKLSFKKAEIAELKIAAYTDVPGSHWSYHNIKNLTLNRLVNGYPGDTFRPDANISVVEFSAMLSRLLSRVPAEYSSYIRNDFEYFGTVGSWGQLEMLSVISKIEEPRLYRINPYDLNKNITRDEAAFLMASAIDISNFEASEMFHLTDIGLSQNPTDINLLVMTGIIKGYPDGTFRPQSNITRAEIASMFNSLYKNIQGE